MNRRFCDRCDVEVSEYAVVSMVGKEYTTLTSTNTQKMMKDMELCPLCAQDIIKVCHSK